MKKTQSLTMASMIILSFLLITQGSVLGDNFQIPRLFRTPRMIMIFDKGLDTHILSIDRFTEVTWINDSNFWLGRLFLRKTLDNPFSVPYRWL